MAAVALVAALVALRDKEPPPTGAWLATAHLEPRFETVDGGRVRYVRAGQGPSVILLHGLASSIYTWKDVLPTLSRTHDVVAMDFPGFGGSDIPRRPSRESHVAAVLGLMDRLGIAGASLVGNSMGGGVAVVTAASAPRRVERLVLLDAAGFNLAPERRPAILRVVGSSAGVALARLPFKRALTRLGLMQVFENDALVTRERVDEYAAPLLRPGATEALTTLLQSADAEMAAGFEVVASKVEAPTLVLWGAQDRWIPASDADLFVRAIAGSRKVVLDRCGHVPQEEQPEAVSRLILEFLD